MMIQSIQATNFKGLTFDTYLNPVTVICGDNFTGKSSRAEALQLALAGFLPGIERRPNAIFERLGSGNPMKVCAVFGNGDSITRTWTKKKGVEEHVEYDGLPDGWACEPIVIDPAEFLNLSNKARVNYLFRVAKLKQAVDAKAVTSRIKKEVELTADNAEEVLGHIKTFEASISARLAGVFVQDWLNQLEVDTKEWKNGLAASIKEAEAGMVAVGQSATSEMVNVPALEKELTEATAQYEAATKAQADAHAEWRASSKLALELGRLACESATTKLAGKELAEKQKRLSELLPISDENTQRLKKALSDASVALDVAMDAKRLAAFNLTTASDESDRLRSMLTGLKQLKCCPTCGAKQKGWRDTMEETLLTQTVEQQERLARLSEVVRNTTETAAKAQTAYNVVFDAVSNDTNSRLERMVIEKSIIAIQQANKAHTDAVANLPAAEQRQAKASLKAQETSDAQVAAKVRLTAAQTAMEAVARSKAIATQLRESAARVNSLTLQLDVAKGACKAVSSLLNELTNASVTEVLTRMNDWCGDILPAPIIYEDGEIGMQRNGHFVAFKSFSGTEKALTQCAVSLALAGEGQIRLAILDEADRLDEGNKRAIYERAQGLIASGKLDQALFIGVSQAGYPSTAAVVRL